MLQTLAVVVHIVEAILLTMEDWLLVLVAYVGAHHQARLWLILTLLMAMGREVFQVTLQG